MMMGVMQNSLYSGSQCFYHVGRECFTHREKAQLGPQTLLDLFWGCQGAFSKNIKKILTRTFSARGDLTEKKS